MGRASSSKTGAGQFINGLAEAGSLRSGLSNIREPRFCNHWLDGAAPAASNAQFFLSNRHRLHLRPILVGHWQSAQQSRRASGAKPIREAPLRAIRFVARRLYGMTIFHFSLRAVHPAKAASRPRVFGEAASLAKMPDHNKALQPGNLILCLRRLRP